MDGLVKKPNVSLAKRATTPSPKGVDPATSRYSPRGAGVSRWCCWHRTGESWTGRRVFDSFSRRRTQSFRPTAFECEINSIDSPPALLVRVRHLLRRLETFLNKIKHPYKTYVDVFFLLSHPNGTLSSNIY